MIKSLAHNNYWINIFIQAIEKEYGTKINIEGRRDIEKDINNEEVSIYSKDNPIPLSKAIHVPELDIDITPLVNNYGR